MAKYHLRPVDEELGLLSVAAFLNRSSHRTAAYDDEKSEIMAPAGLGEPQIQTFVSDARRYTVSGRHPRGAATRLPVSFS